MQDNPSASVTEVKLLLMALTPSVLSGMACAVLVVLVLGSVVLSGIFRGGLLPVALFELANNNIWGQQGDLTYGLLWNDIVNAVVLFLFWALLGVVVVVAGASIVKTLAAGHALQEQLHFVHANRRALVHTALTRMGIRFGVAAIWSMYTWAFLVFIVSYVRASLIIVGGQAWGLESFSLLVLAGGLLFFGVHIHVVFLRLLFLRPRVFGSV